MPVRHPAVGLNASILLVDDNAPGLRARKTVLEELGHRICTASTGADALEQFGGNTFDLVITDIEMEHAKGTDLYAALAAKGALESCRMLFVTGDILNAKVLEFLSKTKWQRKSCSLP